MTEFDVFRRQVPPVALEPTVTVQRDGLLTLNHAAYMELGAPEAVVLLYARRERLMGLRAAAAGTPDAYRVRKPSVGPGFLVSGRAFTRHYEIPTDIARRYHAAMIDGVLTVDLAEGIKEPRRVSVKLKPIAEPRSNSPVAPRVREKSLHQ
jgi:hypothetical protein